jgi:hypothetical protein
MNPTAASAAYRAGAERKASALKVRELIDNPAKAATLQSPTAP